MEDTKGLNLKETEENKSNEYVLVNMVQENFEGYTRYNIKKVQEAKKLQGMIGNPTKQEFAEMVCEELIANCPVTVQDVHNANRIFGPDLANLGARRPGRNRSTLEWITQKSLGTSLICTST